MAPWETMTIDIHDPRLHVNSLTWAHVDPSTRPFDAAGVLEVVRAVAPAELPEPWSPHAPFDRNDPSLHLTWTIAMSIGLIEHYGRWAAGWVEPVAGHANGGGVTRGWCCASDSITTPEQTLAAVAGALIDWREYLEELAEHFARLLPMPDEPRAAFTAWETAIGDLVRTAASRTGHTMQRFGNSDLVLGWFLEAAGSPPVQGSAALTEAFRQLDYTDFGLTGAAVDDIAETLAAAVTGLEPRDGVFPDTWPHNWPNRRSSEQPTLGRLDR